MPTQTPKPTYTFDSSDDDSIQTETRTPSQTPDNRRRSGLSEEKEEIEYGYLELDDEGMEGMDIDDQPPSEKRSRETDSPANRGTKRQQHGSPMKVDKEKTPDKETDALDASCALIEFIIFNKLFLAAASG